MKKTLFLVFALCSCWAYGQDDDEIVYFTDSKVKNSRFSIALGFNPNFTDRRLINDEVPSGGGFDMPNEDATGAFRVNGALDIYYSVGSALDVGVGFGYASGKYQVDNVMLYEGRTDTILANMDVTTTMYTLPIRLNFNTSVSDLWDLEVVPMLELNFINKYEAIFKPVAGGSDIVFDRSDEVRSINYSVGLGLGGTYKLNENWGINTRASLKYMLNPIIEKTDFPRETLFGIGADIGIKYSF